MSTTSLIVVRFAGNAVHFRRHWGGDPVIVGIDILDLLASAKTIKPRDHFSDGSWLLRLMFAHGDEGGTSLPTFEAYEQEEGEYGDWEHAYCVEKGQAGEWKIYYAEDCNGEPWSELEAAARSFSTGEFRDFVEARFVEHQARGVTYDIHLKAEFERRFRPRPADGE